MRGRQRVLVNDSLLVFIISCLALTVSLWLFDAGVRRPLSVILTVAAIGILQSVLRPALEWTSRRLGLAGIAVVCLFSSTLIVWLALGLAPGITLRHSWDGLLIAWIYALLITLAQWILVSRSDDIFLHEIIRTSRKPSAGQRAGTPGFLFVQLDGVSAPLLSWQIQAGNLPNISRLIHEEGYISGSWRAQLPSTTPASQAGILLGSNRDIPGFRWYEKQTGRFIVANEPEGAAVIEQRHSTGKGLLADGGVSVGNLFSGDAPTNIMVMSKLSGDRTSVRQMHSYTAFFSSPFGYMRSVVLMIGEVLKELYQARRQKAYDIRPRIDRHVSFIIQRVATNVIMRHLQTYIVVRNMMDGVGRLYVDFLDYDEIAHHAGIARPEALAALSGLDSAIGIITRARQSAARPYTIILLSDHGQSQGPTFRQLHDGRPLEDFIAEYAGSHVAADTEPVETDSAGRQLKAQRAAGRSRTAGSDSHDSTSSPLPGTSDTATASRDIVVTGSGNIGSIWFKKLPGRADYESILSAYPRLIPGLLDTPGIGLILVRSSDRGHLCLSKNGVMSLEDGNIEGEDPLSTYEYADRASLLRLAAMHSAPDLAVMAAYDRSSHETYAFEELVGNHGGYGGWQTEGILIYPPHLTLPARYKHEPIIGAESLHGILKRWADEGQRPDKHDYDTSSRDGHEKT